VSGKSHNVASYPGAGLITALFFIYLYLPIAVVIFYSFNENRLVSVWTGFSLRWYASAFGNRNLMTAVETSLIVAAISTVIATTVALMAAVVLTHGKGVKYRKLSETVVNLPLLLPEIVVAVAVLILFSQIGIANGLARLVIAHTAFCIPFAFLPIRARLKDIDPSYAEAARDLYATGWTAFRRVTLPIILPGIFAGAMLSFVMSLDDFITSNMLASGGTTTLPVYIFGLIKTGTTPELNAISTVIIIVSLVIATTALWLTFRSRDVR
jgi:spermidine/putrescine transport system permease protein